jgi:hypothetical protein
METLAAIGLSAHILQFVEFTRQLISSTYQLSHCCGSINPLINCRNGLLKAEGPLYSIYRVELNIE